MFTSAIVRPPAPNFAEGLTTSGLGVPHYERALAQHEAYCAALEQCGLSLIKLTPDPEHPDSTFVEDTAVLVEALPHGRASAPEGVKTHPLTQVVLTRPGAPSRCGEVASMRKVLADFFPVLSEIHSPGTLDGGDVCEAGNHFFIGVSSRTNEAGAQQLAELLAPFGYTSSFVDIRKSGTGVPPVTHAQDARATLPPVTHAQDARATLPPVIYKQDARATLPPVIYKQDARATSDILHLKSGLAYLGDNRLVATDALADRAEFSGYELIRVNPDEEYAANCVRVNDHVLVAAGYPMFEGKLRELGYQTIALEMTEFQKMDGGLSCLSLRF
jgi:dimethylargininase